MNESIYPHFVEACESAFSILIEQYAFQPPKVEQIGRECFIRYIKENHIVSIAFEYGSLPIVELFYPSSETGEPPTPWAEKNGIKYTRRIPNLKVGGKFNPDNKIDLTKYLKICATNLITVEYKFLANKNT